MDLMKLRIEKLPVWCPEKIRKDASVQVVKRNRRKGSTGILKKMWRKSVHTAPPNSAARQKIDATRQSQE
jgi:hypothetical protein